MAATLSSAMNTSGSSSPQSATCWSSMRSSTGMRSTRCEISGSGSKCRSLAGGTMTKAFFLCPSARPGERIAYSNSCRAHAIGSFSSWSRSTPTKRSSNLPGGTSSQMRLVPSSDVRKPKTAA